MEVAWGILMVVGMGDGSGVLAFSFVCYGLVCYIHFSGCLVPCVLGMQMNVLA